MRKLKFRIWDKLKNCLYPWVSIRDFKLSEDERYVIQQFIGLMDNAAKDIYEGDIVEFDETAIGGDKGIAEVIYSTDMTLYGPCFCVWVLRTDKIGRAHV